MTEKQKKLAIIIGVVIIAILLLWSRKAGGTTIVNRNGLSPIDISIPSINLPPRSPIAINIPGLPSASPYDYNAVSPCMCNGSELTPVNNSPLITFTTVVNEGNAGPNVYNYAGPIDLWHDGISGDAVAAGCVKGTPCYYGYGG